MYIVYEGQSFLFHLINFNVICVFTIKKDNNNNNKNNRFYYLINKQHIIPLQSILISKNIYNNNKINRFNYQHIIILLQYILIPSIMRNAILITHIHYSIT